MSEFKNGQTVYYITIGNEVKESKIYSPNSDNPRLGRIPIDKDLKCIFANRKDAEFEVLKEKI